MSSLKMHIAITKKVQEDLGFGNSFLLGSVLPDLYKLIFNNRSETHFEVNIGEEVLPDIETFCEKYKTKRNELVYGYLAHLIEDEIWFHEYIYKKYVREKNNGEYYIYLKDSSKHSKEEFTRDIYSDYDITDEYIINKERIDILKVSKELKESSEKLRIPNYDKIIYMIEDRIAKNRKVDINDVKITFFEKQDCDEYFDFAVKEVKRLIRQYQNNNIEV